MSRRSQKVVAIIKSLPTPFEDTLKLKLTKYMSALILAKKRIAELDKTSSFVYSVLGHKPQDESHKVVLVLSMLVQNIKAASPKASLFHVKVFCNSCPKSFKGAYKVLSERINEIQKEIL